MADTKNSHSFSLEQLCLLKRNIVLMDVKSERKTELIQALLYAEIIKKKGIFKGQE